jgi:dTDP-4-dehydrorhamnose reductase
MPTCLVIGADGFLGDALLRHLLHLGWPVSGTSCRPGPHEPLVLGGDPREWILPERVPAAVLCAGVADVLRCEREVQQSRRVNVHATRLLIERLWRRGTLIVYPSSNLVFDGSLPQVPAAAAPNPRLEYGRQKAEIEAFVRQGPSAVLRLGKVVNGPLRVVRSWRRCRERGKPVRAFVDYVVSPVSLGRVLEVVTLILERRLQGVFQVTARDEMDYARLARVWAKGPGYGAEVVPVKCADSATYGCLARYHATLDDQEMRQLLGLEAESCAQLVGEMVGESSGMGQQAPTPCPFP